MATLVSDPLEFIADEWENRCGYRSAVLSGIVPDLRHLDNGGYHCSVEDLRRFGNADDYSNTRPDDRNQNVRYGAAIDMSMSPADMKLCHDRMRRVWADVSDPRRKYLNAFNGWDGSGDAVRLDFYAGTSKYATPDHKWHCHKEVRRRYVLDMTAARAIVSVLRGDSKAQYSASIGQGGPDLTPEEHEWLKTIHRNQTVLDGRNPTGQIYTRMAMGTDHTDRTFKVPHPSLVGIGAQLTAMQTAAAAAEAREAARDAAQDKMLGTILAAAGNPMSDEQFRTLLAEMRQVATEAGAAATERISGQLEEQRRALAEAARAGADALSTVPAES